MEDLYQIGFQPYVQYEMILEFMRHWFQNLSGNAQGVIVGMSGGKDSTIAAYLWAKAIGKDKVLGVMMPDCNVDQSSISQNHLASNAAPGTPMADALTACSFIGINSIVIPVGDIVNKTTSALLIAKEEINPETVANITARARMMVLYGLAQELHYRVSCNSNASEIYLGYTTKYGDFAGDVAPLAHLTKTQVVQLGKCCELPNYLIEKAPEDGLSGKTDEDAFGFTYEDVDLILMSGDHPNKEIKEKILNRHHITEHKRVSIPHIIP